MKRSGFMGSSTIHRECWDLLPWVANERASARDFSRVEEHVRECDECRQELEIQRNLRGAMRAEDAVVLAPQTSLQKLMQRIDSDSISRDHIASAPDHAESTTTSSLVHRGTSRWSRLLPIAAALQGIIITALLGALWWQSRQDLTAPRFTTLTSHAAVARGPVLRVVFADNVTLDDVEQILDAIDAQIIAGPSEAGVYTLGLAQQAGDGGAMDGALTRLRADERVVFSESAVARTETR